ncbi:hypothetical protein HD553DRAFT_11979 [Filobasidium floriforme]|uniref:uncharacterized protein n=1 Tax=Filobasidium floriforme TaxID=5210 RepID=UPI001E8CDB67|nr:uncharacterized protein HD553DRAFT_11979 [Filobasidium floriforme]KAH8090668.1 hypothetical protein HD553DRAFT_11979 [Filobasidium floriforme]
MTTASSGPSLTAPTSTLTIREKLLFSQAVHKVGAGESRWTQVGDLLRACPVVDRPEDYWSDVACRGIYDALMEETGFDKLLVPAQQSQPHAEAHLYLAQHYYELRMQEIRAEIEDKEEKFRCVSHLFTDHDAVSRARKLTPIPSLLPSCSVYCDFLTSNT